MTLSDYPQRQVVYGLGQFETEFRYAAARLMLTEINVI
jgi:hypothetical protein